VKPANTISIQSLTALLGKPEVDDITSD